MCWKKKFRCLFHWELSLIHKMISNLCRATFWIIKFRVFWLLYQTEMYVKSKPKFVIVCNKFVIVVRTFLIKIMLHLRKLQNLNTNILFKVTIWLKVLMIKKIPDYTLCILLSRTSHSYPYHSMIVLSIDLDREHLFGKGKIG